MQIHQPSQIKPFSTSYNTAFQAGFMACAQLMGLQLPVQLDTPELQVQPLEVAGCLADFEQYLTVTRGCRPSSLANARSILGKFERYLQQQGSACYPHQAQGLVTDFLASFKHPSYRYTAIYFLRLFFDFLGWADNPARRIKLPRVNAAQGRHFLTPAECLALKTVLQDHVSVGKHQREYALYSLLIYTGIRVGEALALKWEDISPEGNILIRDSKTHTARVVYVPSQVMQILQQYQDSGATTVFVFSGLQPEKPLSYGVIRQHFKRLLQQAGVDRSGCNLHALRHTFARACIRAGLRREDIQQFLGHKDIRTTEIYTRLLSEDIRKLSPQAHQAVSQFLQISQQQTQ